MPNKKNQYQLIELRSGTTLSEKILIYENKKLSEKIKQQNIKHNMGNILIAIQDVNVFNHLENTINAKYIKSLKQLRIDRINNCHYLMRHSKKQNENDTIEIIHDKEKRLVNILQKLSVDIKKEIECIYDIGFVDALIESIKNILAT